ncbi:phosphate ABC transporter substrate-binding protein [Vibrio maerlii]|uniref:phosphate ABC transporter substrate-binding protein n=1 Tax=Vibrio maerlii TaxID=2231648 RepID=UPI000E3E3DE3|nr:phosphate ABC transporter substrate-binding protein [Vibrio maerlii]
MFRVALASLLSVCFLSPVHAEQVTISGSTSVARVMDVIAERYNTDHKDTYIAVQSIGSTAGITLLEKGVSDIAMSSRFLTDREQNESLTVTPIAYDGLAVVVNRINNTQNLSREQLYKIYKGEITNWKEVGGDDRQIAVVTREASSGTRYSFESLLGLTKIVNNRVVSDINTDNLVVNSNSMVKTIVNHNPHAVGYISVGSVDSSVKAVNFEGVSPSNKKIAEEKYQLARPFMILYKTEEIEQDAKEFIDYMKSDEAKLIIEEYGYTPIKRK